MSSEQTNVLSCSEPDQVVQCPMGKAKPIVEQEQYLSCEEIAAGDDGVTESPVFNSDGLRVLAVDDNLVCLKLLVAMLRHCKFNVTETRNPVEALQILRTRKHEFDIVITDLRMLEMEGLVLLQKISLEMDLPVVMLSAEDKQENIIKAIRYGARDYIIKPPRMAQIKYAWQHVVRKGLFGPISKDANNNNNNNNNTSSVTMEEEEEEEETKSHRQVESKRKLAEIEGDSYVEKGKADEEVHAANADSSDASKKQRRVNWTVDLHNKFTDAIRKIGPNAVPMEILKEMNVPWLTRANVASHLQKFKNAVRSQGESLPQARNGYSKNMNSAAGQNGYQSSLSSRHATYSMGMMTQAIGTNPYLSQKLSYQQNKQNLKNFPQVTNKHQLNHNLNYNLPMNPSAYPAPTMLNNTPLQPRSVLASHPPVPCFNGLRFSTLGNNMTSSFYSCQPFPAPPPSTPALFPAPAGYHSSLAGNMPAATSSLFNADSQQNHMLANGQKYVGLALETENMYPQLGCTAAPDFPDSLMRNSEAAPFETWSMNNNLAFNPAHTTPFETSNLSNNTNVEVHHFHSTTHEELPIDVSFQPINTNLSDEDDNDELINIVSSFNFEGPPSL